MFVNVCLLFVMLTWSTSWKSQSIKSSQNLEWHLWKSYFHNFIFTASKQTVEQEIYGNTQNSSPGRGVYKFELADEIVAIICTLRDVCLRLIRMLIPNSNTSPFSGFDSRCVCNYFVQMSWKTLFNVFKISTLNYCKVTLTIF